MRNLLTGIIVGAVAAALVRELNQYGLAFANWSLRVPRIGEALATGAIVGAVSQIVAQSGGRR
ncbi:hypothetical protein [Sphingomonas sp. NFR15]|uniref:hypothetical protein n=1 Tax=Sphingomonas sp. NFR15 TaxID=1566282 RepID=UPI00115FECE8|nr:hypothetical protein [Sphingomonas sp. NFR15]